MTPSVPLSHSNRFMLLSVAVVFLFLSPPSTLPSSPLPSSLYFSSTSPSSSSSSPSSAVPLTLPSFLLVLPVSAVAPTNEFLAESVWPMAQRSNYAQGSTAVEGPLSAGRVDNLFTREVAGPLTVLYTPDGRVVWGSSFCCVFKVDRSEGKLELVDSVEKPAELRRQDTFRGIYSVLSREGVFYLSAANVIAAYTDREVGNSRSRIRPIGSFDFGPRARDKERILALSMSYDGHIVFCTNQGGVGVVSRYLDKMHDYVDAARTAEGGAALVSVTNSVSIDEYGGVYVVSSRYLHRIWWNSEEMRLHSLEPSQSGEGRFGFGCEEGLERQCQIWSTPYPVDEEPILGRPTKEGSGTTPSLLRDEETGKLYVMIADGQRKQEVMAIDIETGKIVASTPVDFDKQSAESYTEQSILVSGNRLLVTQNALTAPAQRLNGFLELLNAPKRVSYMHLPEAVKENVYLLPVVLGDSPRGYQQFVFDTSGPKPLLKSSWTRNDVGCPNAIPTMSESTGVMYCVGKRTRPLGNYPRSGFTGGWTIEALRWDSGQTVFRVDTGPNVLYNSLYAATQIGPEKEIIYGCIGGLVRVRAGDDPSSRDASNGSRVNSILDSATNLLGIVGGGVPVDILNPESRNFLDIRSGVDILNGDTGMMKQLLSASITTPSTAERMAEELVEGE